MKSRARILLAFAAAMALLALPAREARGDRAVVVKAQNIQAYNLAVEGFRRSFGSEVIVIELDGQEATAAHVRQIRGHEPVAIIAIGSRAASSLRERIDDIPIVFCMVMNAQAQGLSAPNVAGIALEIPATEQLTHFRNIVPGLERIGVIYNPERRNNAVVAAKQAARAAGLSVVERRVTRAGDVPEVARELSETVDGLWLLPDASLVTSETFRHILVTSLERRVPLFVFSAPFVQHGALVAVAPNYTRIGEEATSIVREIMGGTPPGSIPTRDPPSGVVINGATAARIGLDLSDDVRAQATILQ